jgi:hypothetical protein
MPVNTKESAANRAYVEDSLADRAPLGNEVDKLCISPPRGRVFEFMEFDTSRNDQKALKIGPLRFGY